MPMTKLTAWGKVILFSYFVIFASVVLLLTLVILPKNIVLLAMGVMACVYWIPPLWRWFRGIPHLYIWEQFRAELYAVVGIAGLTWIILLANAILGDPVGWLFGK